MEEVLFRKKRLEEEASTQGSLSKNLLPNLNHLLKAKAATARIISRFNLKKTVKELKELGREHGPYFLAYAICIEVLEDILIPAILCWVGKPHLVPVALAFHCEPIAYPLYFVIASAIKRSRVSVRESR